MKTKKYPFILHGYKASYLPATNSRGSRIKIQSIYTNETVIIPYDCEYDSLNDNAINYLEKKGIEVLSLANHKDYTILLSNDFETSIK
ncbi:MAG: hypothetical protein GX612_01535 [Bacteroidales bacterium]|mgnify:CR=1 FL=1|nr:hypothetical protein [Bacteroidales bacterium]